MKPALLIITLLLSASCVPTPEVKEASPGNINRDAPYKWSLSSPLDLKISNSFTEAEKTNITSMSSAWSAAVGNKTTFFSHSESTTEKSAADMNLDAFGDDNILGIYKITHWPASLPTSALAVTQLFGRRFNVGESNEFVRIEHADILVNDNFYDFRTDDNGASGTFDFQTVVLHEMGHFLGLQHKEGDTVMIPAIGVTTSKRAPTSIDSTDIADKYSITLGSTTQQVVAKSAKNIYFPRSGDPGQQVKILIELRADGECVHKENGAVIGRHHTKALK